MTLMAPGAITAASVRDSGVMCDEIPHVHSQGDSPVSAAGPPPHHYLSAKLKCLPSSSAQLELVCLFQHPPSFLFVYLFNYICL